jgi:DNA-binding transcriptional LysR family regulator
MELRTLKYLLSLFGTGSFTAAAKENYVSQPAVSIQLKKLEKELGIKLYQTSGRRVTFTEAGMTVVDYARRFAGLEKELIEHVRDIQELKKGRIMLGTIDAVSIYILPEVFSSFRERYPGIEINLEISSTRPLVRQLRDGSLDLVCGSLPVELPEKYEVFRIFSEPLVFIAPAEHPLSSEREVEPEELSPYPFIFFQEGSVTRAMVEMELGRRGVTPAVSMAIDSQEAIKHLVASGLGLSVLPMKTVENDIRSGSLRTLEVAGISFRREIGLILPAGRYLPMTVRAFLDEMKRGLDIDLPERYCMKGAK